MVTTMREAFGNGPTHQFLEVKDTFAESGDAADLAENAG